MKKVFDSCLIVGRFQTFHIGHMSLVDMGLNLADRVLILIGSSQESGTERNPYDVIDRMRMIKEVYDYQYESGSVMINALSDMTDENDIRPEWGRYVMAHVKILLHKLPEVMIYGNDEARSRWFSPEDIKNTSEFIINREKLPISGTMIREFMIRDQREEWMKCVHPRLHKYYDELRGKLMGIDYYKEMATK